MNKDLNARHTLVPLLRYLVAALLLGPPITLLALSSVLMDSPVNFLGPPAIFMVGLVGWYFISVGKFSTAIKLMLAGLWIAITGIAIFYRRLAFTRHGGLSDFGTDGWLARQRPFRKT